jgi:hypothetical protein
MICIAPVLFLFADAPPWAGLQAVIAELGRSGVPAAEIPSLLSIPRDE